MPDRLLTDTIDAENLITATTDAVNSSRQQLEVATIRLSEGVGSHVSWKK